MKAVLSEIALIVLRAADSRIAFGLSFTADPRPSGVRRVIH